jgi:hypothetical protein
MVVMLDLLKTFDRQPIYVPRKAERKPDCFSRRPYVGTGTCSIYTDGSEEGCGVAALLRAVSRLLLRELEVGGVADAVAGVQMQPLAGAGVGLRRLPVQLVVAQAKVLQAAATGGVLLDCVWRLAQA